MIANIELSRPVSAKVKKDIMDAVRMELAKYNYARVTVNVEDNDES